MSYSNEKLIVDQTEISEIGFNRFFRDVKTEFDINIGRLTLIKNGNKLLITPGKIEMTFKKQASGELIFETLLSVSKIDRNAQHEVTVELDYNEIEEHEKEGYVLVSYRKIEGNLYKVISEIPFSNTSALKKLALSICNSEGKTSKNIIWNGGDQSIVSLYKKIKEIGWQIKNLEFVKEGNILVDFSNNGFEIEKFKEKLSKSLSDKK